MMVIAASKAQIHTLFSLVSMVMDETGDNFAC
jgi:hypothetical protein